MKAFRQVLFVCRVKLIMAKHSIDLDPATNIQISWSEKRHTREAGEVLFSKYLYQRGPSVSKNFLKYSQLVESTLKSQFSKFCFTYNLLMFLRYTLMCQNGQKQSYENPPLKELTEKFCKYML